MGDVVKTAWAEAGINEKFVFVRTYSGYRSSRADPQGVECYAGLDVTDFDLGVAVLNALAHSRFVLAQPRTGVWMHPDVTFDEELYNLDATMERYKSWVGSLQEKYGYKTKRALFKCMKSCAIACKEGQITIRPRHHEKLELWTGKGIAESDFFSISTDSDPSVIGATLRLAFNRCT